MSVQIARNQEVLRVSHSIFMGIEQNETTNFWLVAHNRCSSASCGFNTAMALGRVSTGVDIAVEGAGDYFFIQGFVLRALCDVIQRILLDDE